MNRKRCTHCKKSFLIDQFYSRKRNSLKSKIITNTCLSCRDKQRIRGDRYVKKYGRDVEYGKQYSKKWRRKNKTRAAKNTRNWFRAHPEYNRANVKKWREQNPIKYKILHKRSTHNRRAVEKKANGHFTSDDVKRIYKKQNGKCYYCHIKLDSDYHLDHKIPLSRGGSNYPKNLACACWKCNTQKGIKTASEFKRFKSKTPEQLKIRKRKQKNKWQRTYRAKRRLSEK